MKLIKRKLFGIVVSALLFISIIGGVMTIQNANATESQFEVQSFNAYYSINQVLDVPQGTFRVDGQTITAVALVSYPSGKSVSKTQITLDEAGEYTVEYKAMNNGILFTEQKKFVVKQPLFSTEMGSAVYFGAHKYTPNIKGIVLSLKNYDVFHFNKIIDLSKMTKDDTLFNMYFTPEIIGQNDVNQIDFTFTDIYDPNNFVTYTTKIYNAKDGNYSVAYANGQLPAAVQKNPSYNGQRPTIYIDGIKHVVHINNEYGTWSKINFIGVSTGGLEIGRERLNVKFDYESRRFYTDHLSCPDAYGKAEIIVTDLDDSRLYSNPWDGFTTGEVYMTVSAKKYNAQTCNIVITEIAGENLNSDGFEDELAPEITVNYGDLSYGYAPNGKVNKPYPIFDSSVFDDYASQLTTDAKVYYNYYTSNKVNVTIENGAFIPNKTGVYTIEYSACDLFGNRQLKLVDVTVSDDAESLSFALGNGATEGFAGEAITVKDYTASSTVSKFSVNIKAVNQDRKGIEYEIDADTLTFTPLYSGRYTIEYTCKDYISTISLPYVLNVSPIDKTLVVEDATAELPKYLIKGCTYSLPLLETHNYSTGEPVKGVANPYVKAGASGNYTEIVGGKYTVPQTDTVYIKYKTKDVDTIPYEIPVVDVGYGTDNLDMSKYFVGNGFNVQSSETEISYTSTSDKASMEFINSLLTDNFSMSFSVSSLSNAFTGLDIYLTDVSDNTKTVKFHYYVENDSTYFKINDSSIYFDLEGKLADENDTFVLQYNAKKQTISPYIGLDISIQEYLNNVKFNGFSDKVYLKVEMTGGAGTVFNVTKLNKQIMKSSSPDILAPEIKYVRILGYRELNDVITISPAIASDVLDPNVEFYLTVINPSDTFVKDLNGETLDRCYNTSTERQVKLNEYGRWYIVFYASDSMGNIETGEITIVVSDTKAPVITVNPTKTEYAVNETITIATPTITDNIDSSDKLTYSVIIYKPNTDVEVCNGSSFVADIKGEYFIYYYCMDKDKNISLENYSILVK